MTLEADIHRYWRLHHYMAPYKFPQKGGGRHLLYIEGHPIEFMTEASGNTMLILAGNNPSTSPCFALELYMDQKTATLQTLERRPACFIDGHPDSRNLVRAAYIIAQKRGIRSMTFTDYSHINCPAKVQLANLSFLTTGSTWYESILPITCSSPICNNLDRYRTLAHTNSWRQVGHGLADIDITGIDIDAPGSAMAVMAAMKEAKEYCWFYHKYMGTLLMRSGIESLHGTEWTCQIPLMPHRKRTTRKRSSTNLQTM